MVIKRKGLKNRPDGVINKPRMRKKLRDLLSVKGRDHPDFQVDEFTKMHGLFTFSIVRHPFER